MASDTTDPFLVGDRIAAMERPFDLKQAPDLGEDRLPEIFFHENFSLKTILHTFSHSRAVYR